MVQQRSGGGRPRIRDRAFRAALGPDPIAAAGIGNALMTKTILAALLVLVAGLSAWAFAAPDADARISAVSGDHDVVDATDAVSPDDCPYILQRTIRQIGRPGLVYSNGGYSNATPYSEDTWRDCDGTAVNTRRTYWAPTPPSNIPNAYSGGCSGLKTVTDETLGQRTANGRTEYLWRNTERNDCGRTAYAQQWTICGPIQTVTPTILRRGMFGPDHRVVYEVLVVSTRACGPRFTQTIDNQYWTSTVPATVPAPSG